MRRMRPFDWPGAGCAQRRRTERDAQRNERAPSGADLLGEHRRTRRLVHAADEHWPDHSTGVEIILSVLPQLFNGMVVYKRTHLRDVFFECAF